MTKKKHFYKRHVTSVNADKLKVYMGLEDAIHGEFQALLETAAT